MMVTNKKNPTKTKKNTVGSLSAHAELLSNMFVVFEQRISLSKVTYVRVYKQIKPQKSLEFLFYRGSKCIRCTWYYLTLYYWYGIY